MKKIIITLDLDTERLTVRQKNKAYRDLNDLMEKLNFENITPVKKINFPYNTYYRKCRFNYGIDVFRDKLWKILNTKKIPINRLFGGELLNWATRNK